MTPEEFKEKRAEDIKNNNDALNLLFAVVLEARGEGLDGMFAVARSIYNRRKLIRDKEVLPSTFMPNSKNDKPTFTDIITHKGQYAVYDSETGKYKKQRSPITEADLDKGLKAMKIALNDGAAQRYVQKRGLDPRTLDAVNFRRVDAKHDASQQKEKFVIGQHEFNLSGSPAAEKYQTLKK